MLFSGAAEAGVGSISVFTYSGVVLVGCSDLATVCVHVESVYTNSLTLLDVYLRLLHILFGVSVALLVFFLLKSI